MTHLTGCTADYAICYPGTQTVTWVCFNLFFRHSLMQVGLICLGVAVMALLSFIVDWPRGRISSSTNNVSKNLLNPALSPPHGNALYSTFYTHMNTTTAKFFEKKLNKHFKEGPKPWLHLLTTNGCEHLVTCQTWSSFGIEGACTGGYDKLSHIVD